MFLVVRNESKHLATRGVHSLLLPSRGWPWLDLNVSSVPDRPIPLNEHAANRNVIALRPVGYLAHKKAPRFEDRHRARGIALLEGPKRSRFLMRNDRSTVDGWGRVLI